MGYPKRNAGFVGGHHFEHHSGTVAVHMDSIISHANASHLIHITERMPDFAWHYAVADIQLIQKRYEIRLHGRD